MNVEKLIPQPRYSERFSRDREKFISEKSGCYALATFGYTVLYIGQTKNLRRRFREHLDSSEKNALTDKGRAVRFYWIEEDKNLDRVERGWLEKHSEIEGELPAFNSISSPV